MESVKRTSLVVVLAVIVITLCIAGHRWFGKRNNPEPAVAFVTHRDLSFFDRLTISEIKNPVGMIEEIWAADASGEHVWKVIEQPVRQESQKNGPTRGCVSTEWQLSTHAGFFDGRLPLQKMDFTLFHPDTGRPGKVYYNALLDLQTGKCEAVEYYTSRIVYDNGFFLDKPSIIIYARQLRNNTSIRLTNREEKLDEAYEPAQNNFFKCVLLPDCFYTQNAFGYGNIVVISAEGRGFNKRFELSNRLAFFDISENSIIKCFDFGYLRSNDPSLDLTSMITDVSDKPRDAQLLFSEKVSGPVITEERERPRYTFSLKKIRLVAPSVDGRPPVFLALIKRSPHTEAGKTKYDRSHGLYMIDPDKGEIRKLPIGIPSPFGDESDISFYENAWHPGMKSLFLAVTFMDPEYPNKRDAMMAGRIETKLIEYTSSGEWREIASGKGHIRKLSFGYDGAIWYIEEVYDLGSSTCISRVIRYDPIAQVGKTVFEKDGFFTNLIVRRPDYGWPDAVRSAKKD
ncbi:hypothetical protein J7K50_05810 [bacterium]|nr:hypothetical protein [bacterium]